MNRPLILAALGQLIVFSGEVGAQASTAPVTQLGSLTFRFEREFSFVGAVRELSDGRVIVLDSRETQLVVLDRQPGKSRSIGRVGAGPGEYRSLDRILALSHDSSIVVDSENRRWLVLVGDSIVATLTSSTDLVSRAPMPFVADHRGHVLYSAQAVAGDSVLLLSLDRRNGIGDTVGRMLPVPVTQVVTSRNADGSPRTQRASQALLASPEQATMFADGAIAIVRLTPYRVDWILPGGRVVHGPPLPDQSVGVDDDEKRFFAQRMTEDTGEPFNARFALGWAEHVSPIEASAALMPLPDGNVMIRRQRSSRMRTHSYDVVNRAGALSVRLELPEKHRIVGIGRSVLYVAISDSDGLQTIAAYRMK